MYCLLYDGYKLNNFIFYAQEEIDDDDDDGEMYEDLDERWWEVTLHWIPV